MGQEKNVWGGAFSIAKTEPDKMLVFGWGNVAIRKDGTQIQDLQGDVIDPEELEKAAYDHVLHFRSTGERHEPGLRQKGRLVESCVFTKEKQAAIGIPPGIVPEGWWVGYKIEDQAAWEQIKSGDYAMFSIEGKGKRLPIAKSYEELREEIEKFNPYHGVGGRFSDRNAMTFFSPGNNPAQAARSVDTENKRRTADGVAGNVGGAFQNVGAKPYGAALNEEKASAAKKPAPKKPAKSKTPQPENAGKPVDWASMSDADFVNNIGKMLPGAEKIGVAMTKKYGDAPDGSDNYNDGKWHNTRAGGDQGLKEIYSARGYNAKPKIVDRAELDQYLAQHPGADVFMRGHAPNAAGTVSGNAKAIDLQTGKTHYAGLGVYGNGTYAASGGREVRTGRTATQSNAYRVGRQYSSGARDSIVRFALPSSAKTTDCTSLTSEAYAFQSRVRRAEHTGMLTGTQAKGLLNIAEDTGRYAALRGYDAFSANSGRTANADGAYWIVLNRGAMVMEGGTY